MLDYTIADSLTDFVREKIDLIIHEHVKKIKSKKDSLIPLVE